MKIAFIYGPFCLGGRGENAFDWENIWDDPRGLTGSELSFIRISQEVQRRGHEVHAYTFSKRAMPQEWEGLRMHKFDEITSMPRDFDAIYSWNESEPLRSVPTDPLRLVNLQINSFTHCTYGFQDFVDVWTSPSEAHRQRVCGMSHAVRLRPGDPPWAYQPSLDDWDVITNGCDPGRYEKLGVKKVPGRVIWASSPDRGLHWLLQEWPKIRRAVPHAHLRIFYKMRQWLDNIISTGHMGNDIDVQKGRGLYIQEALRRMEGMGIELVDSVSRNQIDREMAEAECLAYSCDPVHWTEGFSVSLMEACAAQSCPVTTAVDAFPSIYGGVVPMINVPVSEHISEFSDLVVKALSDKEHRDRVNSSVKQLAQEYTWASIAEKVEQMLTRRIAVKKEKAA